MLKKLLLIVGSVAYVQGAQPLIPAAGGPLEALAPFDGVGAAEAIYLQNMRDCIPPRDGSIPLLGIGDKTFFIGVSLNTNPAFRGLVNYTLFVGVYMTPHKNVCELAMHFNAEMKDTVTRALGLKNSEKSEVEPLVKDCLDNFHCTQIELRLNNLLDGIVDNLYTLCNKYRLEAFEDAEDDQHIKGIKREGSFLGYVKKTAQFNVLLNIAQGINPDRFFASKGIISAGNLIEALNLSTLLTSGFRGLQNQTIASYKREFYEEMKLDVINTQKDNVTFIAHELARALQPGMIHHIEQVRPLMMGLRKSNTHLVRFEIREAPPPLQ